MVSKKQGKNNIISSDAVSKQSANILLHDLRILIEQARSRITQQINTELIMLNWHIGSRIRTEILKQTRAEYGEQVVDTIAKQLTVEYGRGYSRPALFRMVKFAEVFPDFAIVSTASRQLSWSHLVELIYVKDDLRRQFYAEMCRIEGWSVHTLRDKIKRLLFERTAIAKKPEDVAKQELKLLQERGELTPDLVFRDPYLLDFLDLAGTYDEKDLENAILREMEQFLLELGTHFSFVSRQKRIMVDGEDYYLDLLFYHRKLKRLVAIELKLGPFKAEHKGQMELYLRWLDKYDRCKDEEAPIGLILCAGKSRAEQIELLALNEGDIRVAEFVTEELPKAILASKFHEAIKRARHRLACLSEPKQIEQCDEDK